ncbi:site-specific integrase [Anthocerotibacter panamensis]|uniref:hypothetical protein n=1 Tax=Anthocerotibacter panamensis TaxID=2857077 RepID=UPI001C4089C5|nr:hypothetical protein [Anthocerotibacter panamensis]
MGKNSQKLGKLLTPEAFATLLAQANHELDAARCRVVIEQVGQRLHLRGTLPPKPRSGKTAPTQQRISLGVAATVEGLKRATAEARKVSALLDLKEFSWEPYLRKKEEAIPESPSARTVGQLLQEFESDYFTHRARTTSKEHTFLVEYRRPLSKLPQERTLERESCLALIRQHDPDSRTRLRMATALGHLARFAGDEALAQELLGLRGGWRSAEHEIKDLPSDKTIQECWASIPATSAAWKWAYGMLATYGLRPHEIWHLDITELEAGGQVVKVGNHTKTGRREVWPCHPEWIEMFDLRAVQVPPSSKAGSGNADIGHRVAVQFQRYKIPHHPYALRHAYAVRLIGYGIADTVAARWMGHTAQVHQSIYHDFLGRANHEEIFNRALARPDRPIPPGLSGLEGE